MTSATTSTHKHQPNNRLTHHHHHTKIAEFLFSLFFPIPSNIFTFFFSSSRSFPHSCTGPHNNHPPPPLRLRRLPSFLSWDWFRSFLFPRRLASKVLSARHTVYIRIRCNIRWYSVYIACEFLIYTRARRKDSHSPYLGTHYYSGNQNSTPTPTKSLVCIMS